MISEKFEEISKRVWTNINLSNRYQTIYGEETITDSILLDLAKQNYFNIRILQTPKIKEGIQGTDWEWFVGSYRFGWIRYAIQAKKLNLSTNRYNALNHKVGEPPYEKYQIDLLREFSNANDAIPLYNFYNFYPTANQSDHWQCSKTFDPELLGWTFTTLTNVDKAINTRGFRTFDKIHQLKGTLPIRCLFKCPYFLNNYQDKEKMDEPKEFLGESFKKVKALPSEFINAREIGTLGNFPEELYNPKIKIYPKRIAIIDLSDYEFNENHGNK